MATFTQTSNLPLIYVTMHYTVLALFLRLGLIGNPEFMDGSSSLLRSRQLSGSKRKCPLPDFDGLSSGEDPSRGVSTSNDVSIASDSSGGLSNSNDNACNPLNEHNITVLDTDANLDQKKEHLLPLIRYLLLGKSEDNKNAEVDNIIKHQTGGHVTCAQFCTGADAEIGGISSNEENEVISQQGVVAAMHVHRGEHERKVQNITVKINNTQSFEKFCIENIKALQLDLRNPTNIKNFRDMMNLKRIELDPNEKLDASQFRTMYYDLIVDFQSVHQFHFSPMNNNSLMMAILYTLLRASPDTVSNDQFKIGSLTPRELNVDPNETQDDYIESMYNEMLHSSDSPMNKMVCVDVYSLTTLGEEGAIDAVAKLNRESVLHNNALASNVELSLNVSEEIERFIMFAISILPDEEACVGNSNVSSPEVDSYWSTSWKGDIMKNDSFCKYMHGPNLVSLLAFSTSMHVTGLTINRVKAENIIMDRPQDSALDARELNILFAAPIICGIMYQATLSVEDKNWVWTDECSEELVSLIKGYCSTTKSRLISLSLGNKRLATLTVLSLWEAAVVFKMQASLMRCFTRATDSLASMYPSTILSNQSLIKQLGETRETMFVYQHLHVHII